MRFSFRLLCLFGRHRRSRELARYEGPALVSRCRGCGTPMRKDFHHGWLVDEAPPAA